jgi:hypothetical protein
MSGQWPPEWEDADDGHSDAGLPDGSAVTSFLADIGSPALPAAFEARISAAIAAEAAARASTPQAAASVAADAAGAEAGAQEAKGTVRSANPEEFSPVAAASGSATPAHRKPRRSSRASRNAASGPARSRPDGRRRRLRMPSPQASGWLVLCCLLIAGFGFLVTHSSGSSSSSSADTAAPAASAPSFAGASEPHAANGGLGPDNANQEPTASAGSNAPTGFLYIKSGTAYRASTLATQVQVVLTEHVNASQGSVTPAASSSASEPMASASSSSTSASGTSGVGGYPPSAGLAGCVSQVTDGVTPSLVDKATYNGKPAYIIALPSQVWVVGLGCTEAHTDVIARVLLKG